VAKEESKLTYRVEGMGDKGGKRLVQCFFLQAKKNMEKKKIDILHSKEI